MRTYKTITDWNDRNDPVVSKIIELHLERRSLREIMDALPKTCSHETVRKYIPRLESIFGEEATPKKWTASEVARKFK